MSKVYFLTKVLFINANIYENKNVVFVSLFYIHFYALLKL